MSFSGYPKVCSTCGQPVRITGPEPLQFEWHPKHGKRSWHVRCLKGGDATTPQTPIGEEEAGAPTPPSGRTCTSPSGSAPTLAGPAPNEGDCALAGATAQADGQTAVAPLYSPTSARSPRKRRRHARNPRTTPAGAGARRRQRRRRRVNGVGANPSSSCELRIMTWQQFVATEREKLLGTHWQDLTDRITFLLEPRPK